MSVRKGGQIISGAEETKFVSSHTIGEIFWTSRLTPQISGAVDADGKIYPVAAFTGKESVPALLAKGELPSISMVEYESIVSTNGSCRAWGWDGGDKFRVPTAEKQKRVLVAKKEATTENPNWYNLYSDGWIEQGGCVSAPASIVGIIITYSKPFIDGNHYFNRTAKDVIQYGNNYASYWSGAFGKTSTGCFFHAESSAWCSGFDWYACGYGAIPTEAEYQFQNIETHRAMVQISTGVKEDATQLKEYKFNNPHFFGESKWTDVEPKNSSWLLSNGAYHSGRTYVDYYNWLTDIKSGIKSVDGVSVKSVDDEYTDYEWVVNTADNTFRLPLKTKLASGSAVAGNGTTIGLTDGTNTQGIETSSNGLKLYFYVGDTVQDASLINAGEVLDYFSKIHTVHCVVETFKSGTSWYRVYDDGWVEQGATISLTTCPQTITLLKQYQDNNYTICIGGGDPDSTAAVCSTSVYSRAVGSFSLVSGYTGTFYSCVISWFACGYGA